MTARQHITWSACGKQLQCTKVTVPLDRSHRSGARITLAVIRHIASRLKSGSVPCFFNPAPGGELNYPDTLTAFFLAIRSPGDWPKLAKDLKAAEDGDGSALEELALSLRSPSGYEFLTPAVAIGCADSPAQQTPREWPQVIPAAHPCQFHLWIRVGLVAVVNFGSP